MGSEMGKGREEREEGERDIEEEDAAVSPKRREWWRCLESLSSVRRRCTVRPGQQDGAGDHELCDIDDVTGILQHMDELDGETEAAAGHRHPLRALPPGGGGGSSGVDGAHTDAQRVSEARDRLKSHCWEERYVATTGMGSFGASQTSAVVELLRCLRDEHALVRAAAANSLAILHQSRERGGPMLRLSVQGLVVALDDAEVWVRLASRRALIACIIVATRAGVLDTELIAEMKDRLGNDRPPVQKAAAEALMFCGVDELGGTSVITRRGDTLASMERVREMKAREEDGKGALSAAKEAKNRYASGRDAVRCGGKYKVGESVSLTTKELASRGQMTVLFLSPVEREQERLRMAALNVPANRMIDEVVLQAEDKQSVRNHIDKYMKANSATPCQSIIVHEREEKSDDQLRMIEKRAAIEALGYVATRGDKRIVDRCMEWLTDSCWGVRCAAAATIGRISVGDNDLFHALCDCLEKDTDPSVRAAAASGLAELSQCNEQPSILLRAAVGALLGALDDDEAWVRLAAERALCACVNGLCVPADDGNSQELSQVDDDRKTIIQEIAYRLVDAYQFTRNAAKSALLGASILKAKGTSYESREDEQMRGSTYLKYGLIVAKALVERARNNTLARECRAEACHALLTYGLWTPSILPAAELHGYLLWKSDLAVRRSSADALRALAYSTNVSASAQAGITFTFHSSLQDGGDEIMKEHINQRKVLVEMLSIGLDDSDVQVRRSALLGLEKICQIRDQQASAALTALLQTESDYDNLSRGMGCLMQSDPSAAREVIPCLVGHADGRVREAARDCMRMLRRDVGLILQDLKGKNWVTRLECLSNLTLLHSRRGTTLLQSKLLRDCTHWGYKDGDCVLAVLNSELCLEQTVFEMRESAPFVHEDGVKVEDEETWRALESVFMCRIELLDVSTLRTVRLPVALEGARVYMAILNKHAFSVSNDNVAHLRALQTRWNPWDNDVVSTVSKLLEDENHFVRHSAARALGDIAGTGDLHALQALMRSFSSPQNVGLVGVIMSSICKLCSRTDHDTIDFLLSQLDFPDSVVCLPVYVSLTEMLLQEDTTCAYGSKFYEICQQLVEQREDVVECIAKARRWALSLLDKVYGKKEDAETNNKKKRLQELQTTHDEKTRREEQAKVALAEKIRRTRGRAVAELQSEVGTRRFDSLNVLGRLINEDSNDLDAAAVKAIAHALYDEFPRVRARAMRVLRQCAATSSKNLVSLCVDTLIDVIRRRDTDISAHAVCVLGEIVPRGTQEVIAFLLEQLNLQKINYLGSGLRRCVWDRVMGFRQATLEALCRIMPSGDSKAFITNVVLQDLDNPAAHVRDAAFEIIAGQCSEEAMYTLVIVKMIGFLGAKQCSTRHFAIKALQELARPRDMRLLLVLRKALEDKENDAVTRMLAAQAMLHIDAKDIGVFSAIRGVIQSESDIVSTNSIETTRSDLQEPTSQKVASQHSFPAIVLDDSSHLLIKSRLALILAGFLDGVPAALPLNTDHVTRYPVSLPTAGDTGDVNDDANTNDGGGFADVVLEHQVKKHRDKERDLCLKAHVIHVPRSLSKMGRQMDERQHLRRQPRPTSGHAPL